MRYWLMKSEPDTFGIDDLKAEHIESWDGVRNYQARNMMRDEMKRGDLVFFYHSSCAEPGIAGIMTITREAYPDPTAFDPHSKYFDSKSNPDRPRWYMVDVRFKRKLKRVIMLAELKQCAGLKGMPVLQRGNRLSITPVTERQWQLILSLE
ncbi:MAG: EVE domain-containing protein [Candidatus Binatia bacterium]